MFIYRKSYKGYFSIFRGPKEILRGPKKQSSKSNLISCDPLDHILDIKLIRTDWTNTTLDLGQKVEKGVNWMWYSLLLLYPTSTHLLSWTTDVGLCSAACYVDYSLFLTLSSLLSLISFLPNLLHSCLSIIPYPSFRVYQYSEVGNMFYISIRCPFSLELADCWPN